MSFSKLITEKQSCFPIHMIRKSGATNLTTYLKRLGYSALSIGVKSKIRNLGKKGAHGRIQNLLYNRIDGICQTKQMELE